MRKDFNYSQTSNISYPLVDNKLADYSDAVGASPTPTTSSLSRPSDAYMHQKNYAIIGSDNGLLPD